jgi:4-alpha-glucanotransferase
MAIVPVQDILGLGSDARMNIPSQLEGNWGWRFSAGLLRKDLGEKLAALTEVCDRVPSFSTTDQQRHREVRKDFAA